MVVLEASCRLGGWVSTTRHQDGVLYEHGPRTVRPVGQQGANTLALVQELGLAELVRPVLRSAPSAQTRLVLADGALHKLPSSLLSVFHTLPPFSRPLALAAVRDLLTTKLTSEDESLHSFISRRLGPDIAQYAVGPLVRGICAGDSKQISVHFIASYLHSLEQRSGRITLGAARDWMWPAAGPPPSPEEQEELVRRARGEGWAVWGMAGGMERLVEGLARSLGARGVEVRTGVEKLKLARGQGKQVVVETEGETLVCDKVILTPPSFVSASLLEPLSSSLATILSSIPFVDVAVTNLEYTGKDVQGGQGFGFLVPSSEPEPILGCIYDTCTFPQGERTVLTVMAGGAWYDQFLAGKDEAEAGEQARQTVSRILGITASPVRSATHLLPRCIAQYTVGHRARLRTARRQLEQLGLGLRLAGSSYDGVGVNDTIVSAKTAALDL